MPIYEFKCLKCNNQYEDLVPYDETGKYKGVKCPHCKSRKKEKLLSVSNFQFGNPIGTDRYENSHDYRYKYKQPQLREQRLNAEKKSHMGKDPYPNIQ